MTLTQTEQSDMTELSDHDAGRAERQYRAEASKRETQTEHSDKSSETR